MVAALLGVAEDLARLLDVEESVRGVGRRPDGTEQDFGPLDAQPAPHAFGRR